MSLSTIDIAVILFYFVIVIAIGLIVSRKAKTAQEYLVAGRSLKMPMFVATMAAVVIGGGTTLGTSELAYTHGVSGIWVGGMIAISIFLMSRLLETKLSNMRILSTSEAVGIFYGPGARSMSALVAIIYLFMIAVVQIVGIGTILQTVFGLGTIISLAIGAAIILAYLTLGGMVSVVYTDIFQFSVMTLGVVILGPIFALKSVGGFAGLQEALPASYFDFGALGINKVISYVLLFVPGMIVGQDVWQKAFTAESKKTSSRGTLLASIYIVIYVIGVIIIGMCLQVVNPNLTNPNLSFATAAMEFNPVGVRGLLLAALLAAIISTANGCILGSSTVIYNDVLKPRMNIPKNKELLVNRALAAMICLSALFVAMGLQSILRALEVAHGYLAGCLFVPLVFAFLLKKVSAKAGLLSLAASAVTVTIFFIKDGIAATTPISFGIMVSAVVFFGVNAFDRKKREFIFEGEKVIIDGQEQSLVKPD